MWPTCWSQCCVNMSRSGRRNRSWTCVILSTIRPRHWTLTSCCSYDAAPSTVKNRCRVGARPREPLGGFLGGFSPLPPTVHKHFTAPSSFLGQPSTKSPQRPWHPQGPLHGASFVTARTPSTLPEVAEAETTQPRDHAVQPYQNGLVIIKIFDGGRRGSQVPTSGGGHDTTPTGPFEGCRAARQGRACQEQKYTELYGGTDNRRTC